MLGKTGITVEALAHAEKALIGAILLAGAQGDLIVMPNVREVVQPKDFNADRELRRIYSGMCACQSAPHEIAVAHRMSELGILRNGDCSIMARCIVACPCYLDYMDYAKTLREYSDRLQGKPIQQQRQYTGFEV